MLSGPGYTPDPEDGHVRALERTARADEAARRAIPQPRAGRQDKPQALYAVPAPPMTLTCASRVVALGALVSVAVEAEGATAPLLFLPDDFRRLGVEPRLGNRWALTLGVDLDGGAIQGVRLVALAPL